MPAVTSCRESSFLSVIRASRSIASAAREPELYERGLEDLVPSGPLVLTSNFRSVPPVLRFVNAVFERINAGDRGDGRRYHALSIVRDDGLAGTVQVVGSEPEGRLSRTMAASAKLATLPRSSRDVLTRVGPWKTTGPHAPPVTATSRSLSRSEAASPSSRTRSTTAISPSVQTRPR